MCLLGHYTKEDEVRNITHIIPILLQCGKGVPRTEQSETLKDRIIMIHLRVL